MKPSSRNALQNDQCREAELRDAQSHFAAVLLQEAASEQEGVMNRHRIVGLGLIALLLASCSSVVYPYSVGSHRPTEYFGYTWLDQKGNRVFQKERYVIWSNRDE